MKKRVLILHGWNATPSEAWFPNACEFFASKNLEVTCPALPGNYFPDFSGWLKAIDDFSPDANSILIGHSLGGVTILQYLSKNDIKVGQIILVATPIEAMDFGQIEPFFADDFNWEKIKKNAQKINLIYEEDDPLVPIEQGKIVAQKLNATLKIVPGGVHLTKLDMKVLEEMIDG